MIWCGILFDKKTPGHGIIVVVSLFDAVGLLNGRISCVGVLAREGAFSRRRPRPPAVGRTSLLRTSNKGCDTITELCCSS